MLARRMNIRHITSARSTLPSLFCSTVLRKKEITFIDLTEGEDKLQKKLYQGAIWDSPSIASPVLYFPRKLQKRCTNK